MQFKYQFPQIKFYWYTVTLVHLELLSQDNAELSGCNRDHMAHKAYIYHLNLYSKKKKKKFLLGRSEHFPLRTVVLKLK